MLPKCVWNHCQISMMKIWQYFALFSWRKSDSTSPQVCCSAQNTILTKFLSWEYSNRDAPFSRRKSNKVSHLVCYSTPARFHACVYGVYQHGSRQSHRNDHAHSTTWICTYNNRLKHLLMSQGPEHSWLKRVTHIATKVHHTKCMITHTHASIYIYIYIYTHTHTPGTMLSHKTEM